MIRQVALTEKELLFILSAMREYIEFIKQYDVDILTEGCMNRTNIIKKIDEAFKNEENEENKNA